MAQRWAIRVKFEDEARPRWARVTSAGVTMTPGAAPPLECTHPVWDVERAQRDLRSVSPPSAGLESGPELVTVDASAQIEARIEQLREQIADLERELGR